MAKERLCNSMVERGKIMYQDALEVYQVALNKLKGSSSRKALFEILAQVCQYCKAQGEEGDWDRLCEKCRKELIA